MFKPLVVLSALVIGSASFAHAESINGSFSVNGTDTFTTSAPYTLNIQNATIQGTIHGTFATYLTDGTSVAFESPIPFNPTGVTITPGTPIALFTTSGGGETFTFNLTDYNAMLVSGLGCTGGSICLNVTGDGYVSAVGPAALTPSGVGAFTFTTQYQNGAVVGVDITTFSGSGSVPPVPEPSSLALLGTGMLSAFGLARRKFNV